jgi:hypothetical protein
LPTADHISEFQQKRGFYLRKPPFYPLNYGDDDLERINGLNGDGQDTVAVRSDFSRACFGLDGRPEAELSITLF